MDWGITLGNTFFNSLDIIICALALIGGIGGAFEGFAKTFTAKVGIIAGIIIGGMFTKPVASFLMDKFPLNPMLSSLIGFLITFAIGYWLLLWLGSVVSKLMEKMGIGVIDSLLGFVFGVVITFGVCAGIIYLFSFQHLIDLSTITGQSYLYQNVILPIIPQIEQKVNF